MEFKIYSKGQRQLIHEGYIFNKKRFEKWGDTMGMTKMSKGK